MDTENNQSSKLRRVFEWVESLLFALLFAVAIFSFLFKSYTVEGESMMPTLSDGDFVIALSLLYEPRVGDIVIVDSTTHYGKPLIKRVIAVGGDSVYISDAGAVTVNGSFIDYKGNDAANAHGDMSYPLLVPPGYVFLMGDNRGVSKDSRYSDIGLIDVRSIVGKKLYSF